MRYLKYALAAVICYLVFLIIEIPAALVAKWAPLPQNVNLAGVSGSLWKGRAEQVSLPQGRQLEGVSWELFPSQLLLGRAALSFRLDGGAVQGNGEVNYGFSGVAVDRLRLNAPIGWLVGNQRLPLQTRIAGGISLNLVDSAQGTPWCDRLQGRLLVNGLDANNRFGDFPLGDLAGNLSCDQGNIKLQMAEADNSIGVEGQAMLLAGNQVQVDATIRPTDGQPQNLREALGFLGQPNSDGAYPFNYSGPIPGL